MCACHGGWSEWMSMRVGAGLDSSPRQQAAALLSNMSVYVTLRQWRSQWEDAMNEAAPASAAITMQRRDYWPDNSGTPLYRCQQPAQPTDASYLASLGNRSRTQSLRRLARCIVSDGTGTCCVATTTLLRYLSYLYAAALAHRIARSFLHKPRSLITLRHFLPYALLYECVLQQHVLVVSTCS